MGGLMKRFSDNEVIFHEGDAPGAMYVIKEGKVAVLRKDGGVETQLATLGKDDFFGEMSLFDSRPRSATIKAVGDLDVEVLTKDDLAALVNDPVVWKMLATLSGRIRAVDDSIERYSTEDSFRKDAMAAVTLRRSLYY